jgi:GcrA cell cycle regulator
MTAEFTARLRALRADGCSFAAIATVMSNEFARPYTRNSIAGACFRAGIPGPSKTGSSKHPKARKRGYPLKRPAAPSVARRKPINPISAAARFAALMLADQAIPVEQRQTLETVQQGDCRWIVGDPRSADWFYCGAAAAEGKPYCGCHQVRAWGGAP